MKKKHFYAAVILLLFLAAGIKPTFATTWIIGPDQDPPVMPPLTIGTWNGETRTFTLAGNTPLGDNIQIIDNGLILDGAGYKITGSGSETGISLEFRRHVTVKNLTVEGFMTGIRLYNSHNSNENKWKGYNTIKDNTISSEGAGINIGASNLNTVNNNTISNCAYGIDLEGSSNNTVTDNTVGSSSEAGIRLIEGLQGSVWVGSDNNTLTGNNVTGVSVTQGNGIYIQDCSYNNLTSNTVSNNNVGIKLWSCNNISLITNSISNNYWGIHLYISNNNTLTGNNVSDNTGGILLDTSCNENNLTSNTVLRNDGPGFYLWNSSNSNTLTGNTASNNKYGIILKNYTSNNTLTGNNISDNVGGDNVGGIHLDNCSDGNKIYHNNFINNTGQANVSVDCTGNDFNLSADEGGGNYWSDWDPDDGPHYVFNGGQDDYPWTVQDGWSAPVNQPPVADAGPDQTVEQESYEGTEVTLDGYGSTDPDSTPGTNDDIVIFDWYEGDTFLGSGETINYTFPLGSHTVTLKVTDSFGETDEDEVIITVVDTTSPEVACSVNPEVLWQPKNHRMVPVVVFIEAIDICTETDDLTLVVTAESSEPDDYKGDGAFTGDVDGADGFTGPVDVSYAFSPDIGGFVGVIDLRAERDGRGVDRIYTITAIVKHASGNETTAICDVTVPYDQGEGKKGKEKPDDQGKGKKGKGKK